jgi:hypothetical protein
VTLLHRPQLAYDDEADEWVVGLNRPAGFEKHGRYPPLPGGGLPEAAQQQLDAPRRA